MEGKKGMSPIIATILLIAFAVALGAMIMNWSSSLVAGDAQEKACGEAALKVRSPICFVNNAIQVNIKNTGQVDLSAVILRVESPDITQDVNIKNSKLPMGSVMLRNVPAVKPTDFIISLIAEVQTGDSVQVCTLPSYTTQALPDCEVE